MQTDKELVDELIEWLRDFEKQPGAGKIPDWLGALERTLFSKERAFGNRVARNRE